VDPRIRSGEEEIIPWPVLSDLSLTMVSLLVLFVVLQFLSTFREQAISAELASKQAGMRQAIHALSGSTNSVQIDSLAPDRQLLTFSSEVLFSPCKATLKKEGVDLLIAVGKIIRDRQTLLETVQVEGHTDTVPIRQHDSACPFPSNWELSSARATRVVTLFTAELGVDPLKLSAIGRSEYHPVDRKSLDRNRRIAIVLQYDRSIVVDKRAASGRPARER
jgi:flagellar motor protein MotB